MSGTNLGKMPILIVSLVIGIVMATTAIVPLVSDYSDAKTFTNEGLWRMKEIESGDVWTRATSGDSYTWSLNDDEVLTISSGSNALLGDTWCIRSNGQLRAADAGGNATTISATASDNTVTISGSGLNGNTTQAMPGYGVDPTGEYMMTAYDGSAYVNGDSVIYATGQSSIGGAGVVIHITATIDDGATITLYPNYSTSGTPTISNVSITNEKINYTKVDGYEDLYLLESITFDAAFSLTLSDITTDYTGSASYSSYVVPYEVTADPDNPAAYKALVKVVPVMAFVALIAAAAFMIYSKRD